MKKKIIKKEEKILVKELPNEEVRYKVVKYGAKKFPHTKVGKIKKVSKNGKIQEVEETCPIDE